MKATERFWSKVAFALDGSGCYLWVGARRGDGYGSFTDEGRSHNAHRWSWKERHGPIPDGLFIDHLCRNRACVNPDHLEAVTPAVNMLRGTAPAAVNARKTHCIRGHKLARVKGRRLCRVCVRATKSAYKRRKRAITIIAPAGTAPAEIRRIKVLARELYQETHRTFYPGRVA